MKKAWYKQFWPWFLIALPTSAVVASLVTFSIFSQNKVSLVAEDYYKRGKAINIDLSRITLANEKRIQAWIDFDTQSGAIRLNRGDLDTHPTLRAIFTHRTLADKDFTLMLNPDASGIYRFQTDAALSGPWFIEIEPFDATWLLQNKIYFPTADTAIHKVD
ncbi:FixH family protein [Thaumasiovibrio subtropicus]|uniref:FixH family protein n=1 Tax=Thaumasiovibrio subtropicus TaxID=1891207 RepID=UPI000B35033D|nr:FixH family protein [Thaumasiovibrio subtropicus]